MLQSGGQPQKEVLRQRTLIAGIATALLLAASVLAYLGSSSSGCTATAFSEQHQQQSNEDQEMSLAQLQALSEEIHQASNYTSRWHLRSSSVAVQ
jgi:hypothetical protein